MTPATRLLEDLRDALTHKGAPEICDACKDPTSMCAEFDECDCPLDPSCHTVRIRWINERRDALLAELATARALYPAAHAIGKRVSVVYPPGEVGPNFTGKVLSLHVFSDRTIAHVKSDGGPVIAVDSAFVHPAPEPGCIVGARIGADAGIAAGRPVLRDDGEAVGVVVPTATTGAFLINTASSEAQQAAMDAVTSVSPSWFPMDGRRVTEESPGEAPYKPVTDKDRRESIARAVIRSKPGSEGGACDIDYRAAALVLFNLLDDIDTLDDACRENDAAFRRLAMVKARRREDVGASFDGYTVAFIGEASYAEGEKRTSEPSRAEESPTSSIADVQKTTFDPAVHGNTFGCLRLGGHIFDRCQRAADHEGPCVPASKPCPDCGTPPSRPHQPGCPTAAKQW